MVWDKGKASSGWKDRWKAWSSKKTLKLFFSRILFGTVWTFGKYRREMETGEPSRPQSMAIWAGTLKLCTGRHVCTYMAPHVDPWKTEVVYTNCIILYPTVEGLATSKNELLNLRTLQNPTLARHTRLITVTYLLSVCLQSLVWDEAQPKNLHADQFILFHYCTVFAIWTCLKWALQPNLQSNWHYFGSRNIYIYISFFFLRWQGASFRWVLCQWGFGHLPYFRYSSTVFRCEFHDGLFCDHRIICLCIGGIQFLSDHLIDPVLV